MGSTGKLEFGIARLSAGGRGVSMATVPLGSAVNVASVRAGISEPDESTKFFPFRKM